MAIYKKHQNFEFKNLLKEQRSGRRQRKISEMKFIGGGSYFFRKTKIAEEFGFRFGFDVVSVLFSALFSVLLRFCLGPV